MNKAKHPITFHPALQQIEIETHRRCVVQEKMPIEMMSDHQQVDKGKVLSGDHKEVQIYHQNEIHNEVEIYHRQESSVTEVDHLFESQTNHQICRREDDQEANHRQISHRNDGLTTVDHQIYRRNDEVSAHHRPTYRQKDEISTVDHQIYLQSDGLSVHHRLICRPNDEVEIAELQIYRPNEETNIGRDDLEAMTVHMNVVV